MNKGQIVCFGEVLWDCYPDQKKLGGAPLNVAAHLAKLGSTATVISRIGEDSYGKELLPIVDSFGLDLNYVQQDNKWPTGKVLVTLSPGGLPSYEIQKPVAWDQIALNDVNENLVSQSAALVFGSLAARNKTSRNTLLHLLTKSKLNICDLNIRQGYYDYALIQSLLSQSNILKINDDEAMLLSELFKFSEKDLYKRLEDIFGLDMIIQTKGAKVAEVYHQGEHYEASSYAITPIDTVGSGDAFLAGFIHRYLGGSDVEKALDFGMRMGAYVATCSGAIPDYNDADIQALTRG